jgi:hypothetical protein
MFALVLVCLGTLGAGLAQEPDRSAAARVLGPHWRQMSRRAGMVFSGTVLGVELHPVKKGQPLALILTKFRVNRAVVGVRTGEVLTLREWAGAWPMHRAMRPGQRMLIFLYPPSRLGLTSPVNGPAGQVALDFRGELREPIFSPAERPTSATERIESTDKLQVARPAGEVLHEMRAGLVPQRRCAPRATRSSECVPEIQLKITLRQLERAILSARTK